jgi:F-type H+-transporting ATPase subunit alpha
LVEILEAAAVEPLAVERQVAIICAAINGHMDEVALADVRAYETEFYRALEPNSEILTGIRDKKQFDDQLKGALDSAVKAFSTDFLARKSAAA